MVKKGPLGKAEEFYIQHHYKEHNIDDICKELDRAKSLVKRHVTRCKDKEENEDVLTAGKQFAYSKGSTIMTQNASQLSDDARSINMTSRQENCTTRIK
jgi:hypothetical protein